MLSQGNEVPCRAEEGSEKPALGKLTQMYVVVVMEGRQSSQVRGRDMVNDRWEVEG